MLRLITGPANSGKTGVIYSALRSAANDHERALLVLPSAPDVARARVELSHQIPLGLEILRMERLVQNLWSLYGDGRRIIDHQERELILGRLAAGLSLRKPLARLASLCIEALCEQTGERWRQPPADSPVSGAGLAALIAGYADFLGENGAIELSEAAHCSAFSRQTEYKVIAVHRFDNFSASQTMLMQTLRESAHVLVSLGWVEGLRATSGLEQTIGSLNPDECVAVPEDTTYTHREIHDLTKALFGPASKVEPQGAVRFVLAEGEEALARGIVAEVVDAILEGGASSYDRIAVVFRTPYQHRLSLGRAFEDAGIEADFDVPLPLKNTPLGAALIDVLSYLKSADPQRLVSLLRSGFSKVPTARVRHIEAAWRARREDDGYTLLRSVGQDDPELRRLLRGLQRHQTAPLNADAFEGLAALVSHCMSSCIEADGEQRGGVAELNSLAQSSMMRMIESASKLGEGYIGLDDLLGMAKAAVVTPITVERPNRVQVMSAARVRGRRFDTVIIAGLNDGEFPAREDETIVTGGAVDGVMGAFGARREPSGEEALEQALLYETLTRARNRVVLCAKIADCDGAALSPSSYFESIADHYRRGEDEFPPHRHCALVDPPSTQSRTCSRDAIRADAFSQTVETDRGKAAARRLHGRGVAGRLELPVTIDVVSPSAIEAYLRCPYRWYYERFLRPGELDQTYGPLDEGSLAHDLLAKTYQSLAEAGMLPLTPNTLPRGYIELERVYSAETKRDDAELTASEVLGRARVLSWAKRIIEEDASAADGYVPTWFEYSFGMEDDPVDLGGFKLRGTIDRIDIDATGGAIITDYKRKGSSDHGANQLLKYGTVQVPLYMLAARERLGLQVDGGFYRGLQQPSCRGIVRTGVVTSVPLKRGDEQADEEVDRLLEDVLSLSTEAVEGMRAGDIAAKPRSPKACLYCSVAPFCRGAL